MLTIYHLESCSKSRSALNKIQSSEIPFQIVDYVSNPLSEKELKELHSKMVGVEAKELCRVDFTENTTNEEIYSFLSKNPEMLQRPILVFGEEGIIGRPIEKVEIFINKLLKENNNG